jgi:tetratricopeptide (TPR) repeat protein
LIDYEPNIYLLSQSTALAAKIFAAYERALQLAPDDIYARNNRGNALRSLGELEAGLSQTEAALSSYQKAMSNGD